MKEKLIVIVAKIKGPRRTATARMALDTGATRTLIDNRILIEAGYDPNASTQTAQMSSASGVQTVPKVIIEEIAAMGINLQNLEIISHTLPPSASVDGLLGLDFLRQNEMLRINFRRGEIELS